MRPSHVWLSGLGLAAVVIGLAKTHAGDWTRFRGPNGSGVSDEAVPAEWGPVKNVKWSIDLPGRGVSSPIVVGEKVFVTSYSGYGTGADAGNMEDLKRHLLCVDRASGDVLWEQKIDAVLPEDEYRAPGTTSHGYASHTPVSDGERVYVFFGKTGVLAFDLVGNKLWQTSVGTESHPMRWGSAASPLVYKDLVIVNASDESEALVALDTRTGEEAWRKEASGLDGTWSTPIIMESKTGPEVVLAVDGETWAFNAETGGFKWFAKGTTGRSGPSHSLIPGDGVVYSLGGSAVVVPVGGDGEVSDDDLIWEGRAGGRFATPILHRGLLFSVDRNAFFCHDAKTGDRIFQTQLGDGEEQGGRRSSNYASPVLAGENLIVTMDDGTFHVVKASDSFELVATNKLNDDSGFAATPAISDGDLFVRSHAKLYCISDD